MILLALTAVLLGTGVIIGGVDGASGNIVEGRAKVDNQEALGSGIDGERYKTACPDYRHYAVVPQ